MFGGPRCKQAQHHDTAALLHDLVMLIGEHTQAALLCSG